MIARLDPGHIDCSGVLELLERQRDGGPARLRPVLRLARAARSCSTPPWASRRPGRALRTDDVMLWYSAGKPLTTVAVLQLWEQGRLGLDDPIGEYVDGWGDGKERCTVRHVLTHTGGFPMYGSRDFDTDLPYDEAVAADRGLAGGLGAGHRRPRTTRHRLEDPRRGRRGRRRPADRHVPARRDPRRRSARRHRRSGSRSTSRPSSAIASCRSLEGSRAADGRRRRRAAAWRRTASTRSTTSRGTSPRSNRAAVDARARPRARARSTSRCSGSGRRVLDPRTVEIMGAVHRYGLRDALFGIAHAVGPRRARRVQRRRRPARVRPRRDGVVARASPTPSADWCAVVVSNGLAQPDRRRATALRGDRRGVLRARRRRGTARSRRSLRTLALDVALSGGDEREDRAWTCGRCRRRCRPT